MIEFSNPIGVPWLAALGLLILALLWVSYRNAKGRPSPSLRGGLIALRTLAAAAIVLCLLDPQSVQTIKHQQKTRAALLLDTSKSMSVSDLPGGRLNSARAWIKEKVLPVVPSGTELSYYSFNKTLQALPKLDNASPTGSVTAIAESLSTLLAVPSNEPLTEVLLVSDGIETSDSATDEIAREYRRRGIPIHTVLAGTTRAPSDIVLENIQVKRAVPNESPTRVTVSLRSDGYLGRKVQLQIRAGKDLVQNQSVTLNGGLQTVEFEMTPKQKGFQVYEASIVAQEGEWLTSNNRKIFGLEVVDPKIRVLYMEGTPQQGGSSMPEWKYLKDALESDPNIKVTTLYRPTGSKGQALNVIKSDPESGERIYPVDHPTRGFPKTLSELLEYDVVIHSDIKKESFTSDQLKNMARLVEDFGGGFVMIGGNSAFGKGGYHKTILDRIIPVAMEQSNDSQARTVRMRPPAAALSHPVMSIGSTREETEMIWKKLPPFHGYNKVDRAKPGAAVLGEDPSARNGSGFALMLAVQEIGKGRSMAFTSDTTRSWGRDFETIWGEPIHPGPVTEENCDSRYYRQFWVHAVRWLASGKAGNTNNPVSLELAKGYIRPNEPVAARVKVRDSELRETANAEISLSISMKGQPDQTVQARYDAAARAFVAPITVLLPGTCFVTVTATQGGARLGTDRQLLVCEDLDPELADIRSKPDFLAALSEETGGKTYTLGEKDGPSPAYAFANSPPPRIEYKRASLWDRAAWLSVILALLAGEWAIRRVKGLA